MQDREQRPADFGVIAVGTRLRTSGPVIVLVVERCARIH